MCIHVIDNVLESTHLDVFFFTYTIFKNLSSQFHNSINPSEINFFLSYFAQAYI